MPYPINPAHRLLLEDNSSFLLLEDNSSKLILDEQIALDDPLNAGTVSTVTPGLTFAGESPTVTTYSTPAKAQSQTNSATLTTDGSLVMANTTTGNTIVVAVIQNRNTDGVTSVSDGTNTYTKNTTASGLIGGGAASYVAVFVAQNITGLTTPTITVNKGGASFTSDSIAWEISGVAATSLDTVKATAGTTVSVDSGYLTTSTPALSSSYLLGIGASDFSGNTYTATGGFGNLVQLNSSAAGDIAFADMLAPQRGAYKATMTMGNTSDQRGIILSFLPKATTTAAPNLTYEVEVDTVNTFNGGITGAVNSYYFNDSIAGPNDPNAAWSTDASAFDGSTSTHADNFGTAGSNSSNYIEGKGTSAPSSGGIITQVRARIFSNDAGTEKLSYEIVTASRAETLATVTAINTTPAAYNSYTILTAPVAGWTWAAVQSLETRIWIGTVGISPATASVYRLEFEVTSTDGPPLLDKTSDLNTGFVDDTTTALGEDRLLLEDNSSHLLLEDNSSKLAINYSYPSQDFITYTVPAATLSNGVTYYWRVRDKPVSGAYGGWSEIRSFTVSAGGTIYPSTQTASLSFVGSQSKLVGATRPGALSFSASLTKLTTYPLTAGLSFVGNFIKLTTYPLLAGLSFSAAITKKTLASRSGALSFVGNIIPGSLITYLLSASLSFSGSLSKLTTYPLTAAVSFSAAIAKKTIRSLSGGLSFVGSIIPGSLITYLLNASLSFSGNINKFTTYPLSAALSFSASLVKRTARTLGGAVSFVGTFTAGVLHLAVLTASLSFSGAISKLTKASRSGSLSFVGTFLPGSLITYLLNASLSFSGSLNKRTSYLLSGSVSFVGSVVKTTLRKVSGAVSFSGAFLTGSLHRLAISGALSFSGAFSKSTRKTLSGALSFVGAIRKLTNYLLTASVTYSGTISRNMRRALGASVTFVGNLLTGSLYHKVLSASLSFAGSLISSLPLRPSVPQFITAILSSFTNRSTDSSKTNMTDVAGGGRISTASSGTDASSVQSETNTDTLESGTNKGSLD